MQTTSYHWPQQYLLNILASAVRGGYCYVHPITEVMAKSLTARLNRLRRRKDKASAFIIAPEYHRVTIVKWEPTHTDPDGLELGRILLTYDKLPPGYNLPSIIVPDEPIIDPSSPIEADPPLELEIPESIDALISRLTTDD